MHIVLDFLYIVCYNISMLMKNKKLLIIFIIGVCVALTIVVTSVLFSVKSFSAYCQTHTTDNELVAELDEQVLEANTISKMSSIFFINENNHIKKTQQALLDNGVFNVEITQIERVFPSRVIIHYKIVTPYFYVTYNGNIYFFSEDLMLIDIGNHDASTGNAIEVKSDGLLSSITLGETYATSESDDATQIAQVIQVANLYYVLADFAEKISFVDITSDEYYFKTIQGCYIYIDSSINFKDRFQLGLSVYTTLLMGGSYDGVTTIQNGTLTVVNSAPVSVHYSDDEPYNN